MHIPDGFLNLPTLIVTNGISIGTLIPTVRKVNKTLLPKRIPLMGLSAAFVFTVQLLSFPVIGGTSVHLMGAVLISILLGPFSGLVIVASALILQAILFQHGGILSLGANIFNTGVVVCLLGYFIYRKIPGNRHLKAGLAVFVTTLLAATFCSIELGLSGTIPLKTGLITMILAHTIAGIIESLVTISILEAIRRVRPDLLELEKI